MWFLWQHLLVGRYFTDERQVLDMTLEYLQAQKDWALASALTDEKRSNFRLHNAWNIGSLENELDNPALHESDRLALEYRRDLHLDVRRRIHLVEQRWAEAGDAQLSLLEDGAEEEFSIMMCGLGSHIAREILLRTRRKLKDPWTHPFLLSQVAFDWARSEDAYPFIADESLAFADELDIGWDDVDVRSSMFECRNETLKELRAVVAYMRSYDEYWRQEA